jgi:hypothetical protein
MFDYVTLEVIVLLALVAYLCASLEMRRRAEDAKWLARQKELDAARQAHWQEPSDVSAIAPQIKRLRQDHLAALHSRPHNAFYRRGILAAFRQSVTSLAFFKDAKSEHAMQKDDE